MSLIGHDNEFATRCPFCGDTHDVASHIADMGKSAHAPDDGDLTLCIVCGEWAFFDAGAPGGLRKPTDAEYVTIADSPMLRKMRKAWVETMKRYRAGPPEKPRHAHGRR